jgi:hypothetical protein
VHGIWLAQLLDRYKPFRLGVGQEQCPGQSRILGPSDMVPKRGVYR